MTQDTSQYLSVPLQKITTSTLCIWKLNPSITVFKVSYVIDKISKGKGLVTTR